MATVETGADKLVELVNQKKSVELKEASRLLQAPPSVVEAWAEDMKEAGLIDITYGLGKVILKPVPQNVIAQKKQEVFGERTGLEKKAVVVEKRAAAVEKRVVYTARDLEALERTIGRRGREAEKMLADLKTLFSEGERFLHILEKTKGGADARKTTFESKYGQLEKSLHSSEKKLSGLLREFEMLDTTVEDVFKRARTHEEEVQTLETMTVEIERDMEKMQKEYGALLRHGKGLRPGVLEGLRMRLTRTRSTAERIKERKKTVAKKHAEAKHKVSAAHRQASKKLAKVRRR